jgi:AcrR family transcriptional regulator
MATLDHDLRRRKIAEVAMELITREGLEAATVRRVAAEVGFSTTIVTHYFSDKQDMLLWAYRVFAEQAPLRFEKIYKKDPTDLLAYLMSMSPVNDRQLALWRAYVGVWDKSFREPMFAAELGPLFEKVVALIGLLIRARNPECKNANDYARRFLALISGIAVQRLFNPQSWSGDSVRNALSTEIELLLGKPGSVPPATTIASPRKRTPTTPRATKSRAPKTAR